MSEFSEIFIELTPPNGGMRRLQKTLEHWHPQKTSDGWRFAAGALAVSMLTIAWLLLGLTARHRQTEQLKELMHEAVAPLDRSLHVVNGAAFELPRSQANVRIFLIQSTPASTP